MSVPEGIRRGALTADEKAEIERLACTMRKASAGRIARRLNRHPATINWHMMRNGLHDGRIHYRSGTYRRGGAVIHHYTAEEDRRLVELRIQGRPYREIADILSAEFGTGRNAHSVHVRNTMLAALAGGPEGAP